MAHMAKRGLHPKAIIWDGEPHRFPGKDQERGTNGWYVAFPDQAGAVFGDWRESEARSLWKDGDAGELNSEKIDAAHQSALGHFKEQRRRREAMRREKQATVARECQEIWAAAQADIPAGVPYLARKELPATPPGARLIQKTGDQFIIVPMYDPESMKLQSLQWIATDGTSKKNHPGGRAKGCCCPIGENAVNKVREDTLFICEGWATAVTIHLATSSAVVIAFCAGNFERIVVHYRKKYPKAKIIVCADNDRYKANGKGKHNPGVTAARNALKAARQAVPGANTNIAIPDFESSEGNPTDFDDLRQREGLDAVRTWLDPSRAKEADTRAPFPADKLQLNGSGADDLLQAFTHFGIEARYDLRGQAIQFRLSEPLGVYPAETWIVPDDRLEAALQERVRTGCVNVRTRREPGFVRSWPRLINASVAEHQVDPLMEYFDSVPHWDREERLPGLLCQLFKADDDPLVRWAGTYILLAVIQRTYQPACKLREIPVLIGPQRCGKSALLRNIFPREHRDTWYGGALDLAGGPKRRVEALLGRALVELSEMAGAKKTGIHALKSFLTLEDDGSTRLSYDRRPSNLPRRCAFVATANDPHCLPPDITGNTRFVAITLNGGSPVEAHLDATVHMDDQDESPTIREQLWAEALSRYRQGERANLPRELYARQERVNLAATTRPAELQDEVAKLDITKRFSYREVAEELGLVQRHADSSFDHSQLGRQRKDIREAMHAAGWVFKRRRRDGVLVYCWLHPSTDRPE